MCIESLKQCPEAIESDLVIFSDDAPDKYSRNSVDNVRDYIKSIVGFKSISIIIREKNFGVDNNIIEGIKYMSEYYDSFIVVEDDLVVSSNFLSFVNACLIKYKNYEQVLTVSAFNSISIPHKYIWDCYFAKISNPWGWATWSEKIKKVDWELAIKNDFSKSLLEQKSFNSIGSDRSRMLLRTLKGDIKAWDIRLDYYLFKTKNLTVYSSNNFVLNIGFNSDATNTFGYNRYKSSLKEVNDKKRFKLPDSLIINKLLIRRSVFKNSFLLRIKTVFFKLIDIKN